jgi:hypothetical protein
MHKLIASIMMASLALSAGGEACKAGYTTTIAVLDPDGKPVSGANITLALLCGSKGTTSGSTTDSGAAEFPYSLDNLGEIRITLAGFSAAVIDKGSCTGPDTAKKCVIKFGT